MGLCIRVCDTNVQGAIGTSRPESLNQQVTSFIFLSGGFFVVILFGGFVGQNLHILIGATVDEGFVACCQGGADSVGQIHQSLPDFIMPKNHKTESISGNVPLQKGIAKLLEQSSRGLDNCPTRTSISGGL
jgi:hypothetical protein